MGLQLSHDIFGLTVSFAQRFDAYSISWTEDGFARKGIWEQPINLFLKTGRFFMQSRLGAYYWCYYLRLYSLNVLPIV